MAATDLLLQYLRGELTPILNRTLAYTLDQWTEEGVPTRLQDRRTHDAAFHLIAWFDKAENAIENGAHLADLEKSAMTRFLPWYRDKHATRFYDAAFSTITAYLNCVASPGTCENHPSLKKCANGSHYFTGDNCTYCDLDNDAFLAE